MSSSHDNPNDKKYVPPTTSQDGQQEIVSDSNRGQSPREQFKCAGCDNINMVSETFGVRLCANCVTFICKVVRNKKFSLVCIGGHGNCRTTYTAGRHIKCQSCRVKRIKKLNIQNPAWNRIIAEDRIKCEPTDDLTQPDYHCAGCDSHKNVTMSYGVHLCFGCQLFIRVVAKKKFRVRCLAGSGNCRITYKAGGQIKCSSCRLKRMIKLDIQHPAWISYKAEHRIDGGTSDHDLAPPCTDKGDGGREYSGAEEYMSPRSGSLDRQQKIASAPNHCQGQREKLKCAGCDSPRNVAKCYGLNICPACRMAIFKIARIKFRVNCIGGQGNCRTTYSAGQSMMCQSCRLKKFIKLDVQHPAWIKFKAKHTTPSGTLTPSGKQIHSHEDDEDRVSVSSSSDDGCACDSCHKFENCWAHHGLRLCSGCDQFIYATAKRNFQANCITGLGNCSTTYKAGARIRCSSCRIKRIIKLDIRHPAWVEYKSKHIIKDETIDDLAPPGEEIYSDEDRALLSSGNLGDKNYSIDDREAIVTPDSHCQGQCKLSKCAGCDNPYTPIKVYGMLLCPGCLMFIRMIAKKNFKVNCIGEEGSCIVTYRLGKRIRCAYCRLKKLMKLNISHPAWVRYKTEQMIEDGTHDTTAARAEKPDLDDENEDDDDDKESQTPSQSISNIDESDEVVDEGTVRIASKSLIGPGEDCDADDEIEMIEINCD